MNRTSIASELLFGVDFIPRRPVLPPFGAPAAAASPVEAPAASPSPTPAPAASVAQGMDMVEGTATESASAVIGRDRASVGQVPPRREAPRVSRTGDGGAEGSADDRAIRLEALRAEHEARCPHCTTATSHTRTVFGEGDPAAALMFIGEAPGETEDRLGRPFVGRAGEKLDEIIRAMTLRREQVYIANVLKSRPPDNRAPLQHEVDACGPYLRRQIAIIRPTAIVTLGGPATKLVLGVEEGITRLRGIWARYVHEDLDVPVMPTFHPAYLLRNYTPQTRRAVWEDMRKVMDLLGLA